jgi:hypothetical protein
METKIIESALSNMVDPFDNTGKAEISKIRVTILNVEAETIDEMRKNGVSRSQNGVNKFVKTGIRFVAIHGDVGEVDFWNKVI